MLKYRDSSPKEEQDHILCLAVQVLSKQETKLTWLNHQHRTTLARLVGITGSLSPSSLHSVSYFLTRLKLGVPSRGLHDEDCSILGSPSLWKLPYLCTWAGAIATRRGFHMKAFNLPHNGSVLKFPH